MRKKKKNGWLLFLGSLMILNMSFTVLAGPSGPGSSLSGGWRQEEGNWYYYDGNGQRMTGWIEVDGKHYYLYEDGHCAMDEITPDGHRVDENGAFYELTKPLIGTEISVANRFVKPDLVGSGWGDMRADLDEMAAAVRRAFGTTRRLIVGGDAVEYRDMEEEQSLLSFYKDVKTDTYRLELHIRFDRSSTDMGAAATYDYGILMGILSKISSTPDQLCEAIYSAWQEENSYQISRTGWAVCGDCEVKYEAENGYGKFYIR